MVKLTTVYTCSNCGYESAKWNGKCPECGNWNTFEEQVIEAKSKSGAPVITLSNSKTPQKVGDVKSRSLERISTNIEEFDRVLGGIGKYIGIVPGSVVLLSGDPGVGKSTIMLQIALQIAKGEKKVLYVSGEESESQVKIRAERIVSEKDLKVSTLSIFSSTDIDQIISVSDTSKIDLLIVDSIQTMSSNDATGFPGSLPQIRYATMKLVNFAKKNHIPVFLIGHVTKDGVVAGPMLLSHMVDCVLYLEGDTMTGTRIIRSFKNRFGDTSEVGIFLMEEKGLIQIANTQEFFLSQNEKKVPGSCITVVMEGSRPLLVEIQALAVPSQLAFPRRVSAGIPDKRLELLLAVLQKHGRINVDKYDIFVNVVGGLKVSETASDLAVCLAIASSIKNNSLKSTVAVSEVGLLGELKSVVNLEKRIKEAEKFGFKKVLTIKNAPYLWNALKMIADN